MLNFEIVKTYLCERGQNVLLHGYGSKRDLIVSFAKHYLETETFIVVNGFFPHTNVTRFICEALAEALQITSNSWRNIIKAATSLKDRLIYLLIPSMDGPALRSSSTQAMFASLAALPSFRILATVDNLNFSILWSTEEVHQFNWLHLSSPTFIPYTNLEEPYTADADVEIDATHTVSSIEMVLNSVSDNTKQIFLIFLKFSFEDDEKEDGGNGDVPLEVVYRYCKDNFIVNREGALRQHLVEFIDHKMLKMKRTADGSEYLTRLITVEDAKEVSEMFSYLTS